MLVTASEFRANVGKYLAAADKEMIIITKNGKGIAELTGMSEDKVAVARSLFGILPKDASIEKTREERLRRREGTH